MKSLVQVLSKFQGIMIICTLNLRYRCSMTKRNIFILSNPLFKLFQRKKSIFILVQSIFMLVQSIAHFSFLKHWLLTSSAIDLHGCAIDCTVKIFGNLATGTPCNRFAWLCNRLHAVWFWKIVALHLLVHDFFYKPFLQRSLHFSLKNEPNNDDWNEDFKVKETYLAARIYVLSLRCCLVDCYDLFQLWDFLRVCQ